MTTTEREKIESDLAAEVAFFRESLGGMIDRRRADDIAGRPQTHWGITEGAARRAKELGAPAAVIALAQQSTTRQENIVRRALGH